LDVEAACVSSALNPANTQAAAARAEGIERRLRLRGFIRGEKRGYGRSHSRTFDGS
jgi:hypothetical protein